MAISRLSFSFFLLICSWAFVGYCEGADAAETMQCIQKLMPCQAFLKGSSSPATSCCVPLKEIMADDGQCLCAVFEDETILKSLNVTQDDFLGLAKSCGANADTSICHKGAATPSIPPSAPSNSNNSASASTGISNAGGYVSLAAAPLTYFIISAF
ncbi:lipid transfer-like protein VAS [Sesamum indicum]|uniref:Lipid transfer-like protein VAS n=1 Tax=Sesamum indicum TaxID=4182 RepID=A0A6I9TGG1_SESIN|nr:lipid transfer-like protein VAS [Sesamum indicum]